MSSIKDRLDILETQIENHRRNQGSFNKTLEALEARMEISISGINKAVAELEKSSSETTLIQMPRQHFMDLHNRLWALEKENSQLRQGNIPL